MPSKLPEKTATLSVQYKGDDQSMDKWNSLFVKKVIMNIRNIKTVLTICRLMRNPNNNLMMTGLSNMWPVSTFLRLF